MDTLSEAVTISAIAWMTGVRFWPFGEVAARLINVRSSKHSGLDLLTLSSSHFDPCRTSGMSLAGTCPLQASPASCRASVPRSGQPREKRSVRGEPPGYELREEPHALRLACLPLCEKPERSVHVQVGARQPRQQWVGISDAARQCRHPEPLPYCGDLRLGVRGPERNPGGANLTLAGPVRDS